MDGWSDLASACTSTGDRLVLRERAGTVELRCNGWELMSNRAHHSEEMLATLACERMAQNSMTSSATQADCATGAHVLIGGLGLGYTLRAALDRLATSAHVTVAELLPEITAWNRGPLARFAARPLDDPRVTVACTDIAALLRAAEPASFDAILLDTDNGPDSVMLPGNASLYGPEGLRLVHRALRPSGTLAVWSADPSARFEHALRDTGFQWHAHHVPARGAPTDPPHTIYLAWEAA